MLSLRQVYFPQPRMGGVISSFLEGCSHLPPQEYNHVSPQGIVVTNLNTSASGYFFFLTALTGVVVSTVQLYSKCDIYWT